MIRRLLPLLAAALLLGQPLTTSAADLSPQYVQRSARCPVCGMYPYRTPQWTAQIVFNDQTASSFDSPVDLFRFLNNMVVFDKQHKPADIGAIYVADYSTKAWGGRQKSLLRDRLKNPRPNERPQPPRLHHPRNRRRPHKGAGRQSAAVWGGDAGCHQEPGGWA